MKSIVVIRREGKVLHDQAQWLNIEDVNFSEPEKIRGEIRTVLHTDNGEFVYCTTNDQIVELLSKESGFLITDRGRMANLKKEIVIDYEARKIFYQRYKSFVTIANSKLKLLKQYMHRHKK
ncbi:hypothetical protein JCM10914A_40760 [Paenibacillus sp. JCM 10914]|uniref:hypothetical protein n=1 Tax=Paenibacillus sp. JCM 10914 TaxID=1236974 RepID=UPI0003CC9068|nr:hypothetical protein [Paenibacillus sp. JCM 10914]GAE05287.1 hypothetical protein JCM10914_1383 [Paenibacillus sp. JCM 10914]